MSDAIETRNARLRRIGFQPGRSGNPRGKKKGAPSLTRELFKLFAEQPEKLQAVAASLVQAAIAGDIGAQRLLFERLDGSKPSGFTSIHVDASTRTLEISPQVLRELADARQRHESERITCESAKPKTS